MNSDLANGLVELAAVGFILLSVRRVLRDRLAAGISAATVLYFCCRAAWGLYFFLTNNLPWTACAALLSLCVNFLYLVLILHYSQKPTVYDSRLVGDQK